MLRMIYSGEWLMHLWLIGFVASAIVIAFSTGFLRAHKIQPRGFKWKQLGFEALVAVIGGYVTAFILGNANRLLTSYGFIAFDNAPVAWWRAAIEYAAYFFLFDTWFYWLHRGMHKEPFYSLIHKIHHKSTSPNLLTTVSVNPLESVINGGFVPIFLTVMTLVGHPVGAVAAALILPTNIVMGLYVHAGFEFLPRWWHKSWATKWFITSTFHDQHHKFFNWNFGGYTTIWDRICGTTRAKFETDYDKICDRRAEWWRKLFARKPSSALSPVNAIADAEAM
ncbi:sterol desaturase/sphingolipid hydroxylase (fatty acid hydroxylase superfamily) [Novosphingobium sp. PhB165]|uniref:sterol desaturase family protein n=1 Tax=Novosphingobium sp. PhB165 TaxID=2485105 RepID=UPI001046DA71|nr:sterol desaturase family protein [Novosphingobium sp. PhB165]TCM16578.1 sterol desaturase/sphingolipid hydroxylase (fatty acid hydroxylase superfamily) [Novosphingobium sp. PhB165]